LAGEIGKRRPFERPEQEAHLNLLRTTWHLQLVFDRLFRGYGLSHSTYNILRVLRGDGRGRALSCGQINGELVTPVPDVTRLVDRLVRAGLVEREKVERDRRLVLVRITRGGLDLLSRLDGPVAALERRELGHLSASALRTLSRLLERLRVRRPGGGDAGEVGGTGGAGVSGVSGGTIEGAEPERERGSERESGGAG
jgi:DNA-binding MarR family transcriptional regulator